MSTSRKQNRLSIFSVDFTRFVASNPAIKVTLFMKHSKNLARILRVLKIRKKLGKTSGSMGHQSCCAECGNKRITSVRMPQCLDSLPKENFPLAFVL